MKRIVPILFVLLFAVPFYAADRTANGEPSGQIAEKEFPTISRSQDRRPVMKIATEDDVICGYHPAFPNCNFRCIDGVPVLNPDGSQRIICWQEPIYPELPHGICSNYYKCHPTMNICGWAGTPYEACIFLEGSGGCTECPWY